MRTIIIAALALSGCAAGGTTTTPVSTQAAQDVGRDQGSAQATESGSANSTLTPITINALAAKKVTIKMENGQPAVEIEGSDDAEVSIEGGRWGYQTFAETQQDATVSSGGGAAGGVGGTNRAASSGSSGSTSSGGGER